MSDDIYELTRQSLVLFLFFFLLFIWSFQRVRRYTQNLISKEVDRQNSAYFDRFPSIDRPQSRWSSYSNNADEEFIDLDLIGNELKSLKSPIPYILSYALSVAVASSFLLPVTLILTKLSSFEEEYLRIGNSRISHIIKMVDWDLVEAWWDWTFVCWMTGVFGLLPFGYFYYEAHDTKYTDKNDDNSHVFRISNRPVRGVNRFLNSFNERKGGTRWLYKWTRMVLPASNSSKITTQSRIKEAIVTQTLLLLTLYTLLYILHHLLAIPTAVSVLVIMTSGAWLLGSILFAQSIGKGISNSIQITDYSSYTRKDSSFKEHSRSSSRMNSFLSDVDPLPQRKERILEDINALEARMVELRRLNRDPDAEYSTEGSDELFESKLKRKGLSLPYRPLNFKSIDAEIDFLDSKTRTLYSELNSIESNENMQCSDLDLRHDANPSHDKLHERAARTNKFFDAYPSYIRHVNIWNLSLKFLKILFQSLIRLFRALFTVLVCFKISQAAFGYVFLFDKADFSGINSWKFSKKFGFFFSGYTIEWISWVFDWCLVIIIEIWCFLGSNWFAFSEERAQKKAAVERLSPKKPGLWNKHSSDPDINLSDIDLVSSQEKLNNDPDTFREPNETPTRSRSHAPTISTPHLLYSFYIVLLLSGALPLIIGGLLGIGSNWELSCRDNESPVLMGLQSQTYKYSGSEPATKIMFNTDKNAAVLRGVTSAHSNEMMKGLYAQAFRWIMLTSCRWGIGVVLVYRFLIVYKVLSTK